MISEPEFLKAFQSDWSIQNLLGLKQALEGGYRVADVLMSEVQQLSSLRNPSFLKGQLRWHVIDKYLELACQNGILAGITPVWSPAAGNRGTLQLLELRGAHSAVSAHHLFNPTSAPKKSKSREMFKRSNGLHLHPDLFDGVDSEGALTPLLAKGLIVHGLNNKAQTHASIRIYYDLNSPRAHVDVFGNIMALRGSVKVDDEQIDEAIIRIKRSLDQSQSA